MLSAVRRFEVASDDSRSAPWPLYPKPLLRWSNPHSGVRDGIVILWTDGVRPAILAQIFSAQEGPLWFIQCQSLESGPFVLRDDQRPLWEPRESGEKFQLLEGPPHQLLPDLCASQARPLRRPFCSSADEPENCSKATTPAALKSRAQFEVIMGISFQSSL